MKKYLVIKTDLEETSVTNFEVTEKEATAYAESNSLDLDEAHKEIASNKKEEFSDNGIDVIIVPSEQISIITDSQKESINKVVEMFTSDEESHYEEYYMEEQEINEDYELANNIPLEELDKDHIYYHLRNLYAVTKAK